MKVWIIDDERAERLRELEGLPKAKGKAKVELPPAKELHAMARNGETPEAFARKREQLEALAEATDRIRGELHDLISEADALGIRSTPLVRWSGYSARRIYQIARER
jgi:hypothetical protein